MRQSYKTKGVCSAQIEYSIENEKLHDVKFFGGCEGNLKGISKLVEGMHIDDVINKLNGLTCKQKSTSCPDQLVQALMQYKKG